MGSYHVIVGLRALYVTFVIAQKINKDSFFYHCSICQYDICMNCFGSIKALQQQSTQSSTNNDAVINEIKDFYQLHNPDKLKDIDALLLKYTPTDLLQRIKEKYKKCAQPDLQPLVAGSPLSPSPSPNDNSGTQFSSSGPSFKSSNSNSTNNSQTSGVWSSSAIGLGNQWSNKPSQTSGVWSSSAIGWGNQWSNKPSQATFGQSTHATGFNISSSNPFSGTEVVLPAKASQPNFKPTKIHEGGRTLNIQSICADDEYLQISPEELQLTQSVGSPSNNTTQSTKSSSVAANTIASADTRSLATSLLPSASEAWIKVEPNNPNPVQFSIGGGTTISGKVSAIWIKCSR